MDNQSKATKHLKPIDHIRDIICLNLLITDTSPHAANG